MGSLDQSRGAGLLRDRLVVVTGAGRGIGRAVALGVAAAGAKVVVSDLRQDQAEYVAREIRGPVIFLASTMASYVNGAILPIDGGFLAG